ncbi:MAG TPA: 2-oxoacid:acceptor oxidoreductase family protein [Anaerolineaceae bacterium]|nr:2-oxoacid:acceptor oxidoreductase family protein [Anaerolineaceae bacterium]
MQTEIMITGFGGQGVLFAGQLLSYGAMDTGKQTTWIPSYGPEMRGGTANCTVIIADEEIGSPLVRNPRAVVAMNLPSLEKYEPLVKEGGVLVVNTSIIPRAVERKDLTTVLVPANDIAERLGDKRMTNMVMIGALIANLPVLPISVLEKALEEHLPARHHRLLPLNCQALREGATYVGEKAC